MLKRTALLPLGALALLLLSIFTGIAFSVLRHDEQATVPILMQFPTENVHEVAAAPTNVPALPSASAQASTASEAPAFASTASSPTSETPFAQASLAPTMPPTSAAATALPTATDPPTAGLLVARALPTALPFPTLPPAPAPTSPDLPQPLPAPQTIVPPSSTEPLNPIQRENLNPGTPLDDPELPAANTFRQAPDAFAYTQPTINGYASATSINKGESIAFYVSTTRPSYTIQIFRMGWYEGVGSSLKLTLSNLPGVTQPTPDPDPTTGLIEANWQTSYLLQTPTDWTTGVYLASLTADNGEYGYIIFVLRDDATPADILFQIPVTTYQAYNNWGGKSLYDYNSTDGQRAYKVSFDRPYANYRGAGDFFAGNYNMIRFLESQGYNVSYATSVDTETSNLLSNKQIFLTERHDEYWSMPMRNRIAAARDGGNSLAFFAGNSMYWQIRFEPSSTGQPNRVITCYKSAALDPLSTTNPSLTTVQFRQPPVNLPENAVLGGMYESLFSYDMAFSWVVQNANHWIYTGTGLADGDQIPGVVGYEYDRLWNNGLTPAGTIALAHSPVMASIGASFSNGTIYQSPSGALVFNAGTMDWSWKLDDTVYESFPADARLQQMTRNLLNVMIGTTIIPPTATPTASPTATASPSPGPGANLYRDRVLQDGAIAYWRLGEATGTTAADEKVSYPGSYVSSPSLGQPGALVGDANPSVEFNGSSSFVNLPYTSGLNPSTFTIEAWAYSSGGSSYRGVASSRNYPNGWVLYASSGNRWSFWINDGSTMRLLDGPTVQLNTWTHLVATFDGTTASLYVNGSLVTSAESLSYTANTAKAFTIGQGEPTAVSYFFPGRIDEVSFYNRALSPAQVSLHYSVGASGVEPTVTSTWTATATPTRTATATDTPTPTDTSTATPTDTPSVTATRTATATESPTSTPTDTPTATSIPATTTPTRTATATSIPATATPTRTPTATVPSVPSGDTLAFYNPGTKGLSLVNTLISNPPPEAYYTYIHNAPVAGTGWVMGDWNGDGQKTPGIWQAGVFRFTNGIGASTSWSAVWLGNFPGAYPVAGRFDSAFTNDCFGVARLGTTPPPAGFALSYTCEFSATLPPSGLKGQWLGVNMPGTAHYQMVAGDWDGDGLDSVAARREHLFGWTNIAPAQGVGRFPTAQNFGTPSGGASYAVAGDWDNNGVDSFGLYYPASGAFYRRNDLAWNSGIHILQQLGLPVGNAAIPSSWRSIMALSFDVPFPTEEATIEGTVPSPEITPELTATVTPELTETVTAEVTETPELTETVVPVITATSLPEITEEATEVVLPTTVPTLPLEEPLTATVLLSPFPTLPLEGPSTATPSPFPPLPIEGPSTATPLPVLEVISLPAYASMDDGAPDWQHTAGWTLSAEAAYGATGLGWGGSTANSLETLRWNLPLDLRPAAGQSVQLTYASLLSSSSSSAIVQVSLDGVNWFSLAMPSAREQWGVETVDLSSFAGNLIYLQFVWQGSTPLEQTQLANRWLMDEVRVAVVAMPLPTGTLGPTEPAPPTKPPIGIPTLVETPDPVLQPTSEIGRHEHR